MFGLKARHALSRRADIIICDEDGMKEALEDAGIIEKLPLDRMGGREDPADWRRPVEKMKTLFDNEEYRIH